MTPSIASPTARSAQPGNVPTHASDPLAAQAAAAQIGRYILNELAPGAVRQLRPEEPLFESVLDSTSVLALVHYIEQHFAIEIADREIVPGNFSTLQRLGDYVATKAHAPSALRAALA